MLAGLGGAGAGAGGLAGLSHTAGFNQFQPTDVGEDAQDFQEIDAKPIQTQGRYTNTKLSPYINWFIRWYEGYSLSCTVSNIRGRECEFSRRKCQW